NIWRGSESRRCRNLPQRNFQKLNNQITQPLAGSALLFVSGPPLNGRMSKKSFIPLMVVAIILFSATLFGQTTQASGKVLALSSTTITIQSGTDVWDIKRT